jgi:hypothetical protein
MGRTMYWLLVGFAAWQPCRAGAPASLDVLPPVEFQRRLRLPINVEFFNVSLKEAVDDIRRLTGLTIVLDLPALEKEGSSADRRLSLRLEGMSVKSTLVFLAHQVGLTIICVDEVIQVTTEASRIQDLIYPISDLVLEYEGDGEKAVALPDLMALIANSIAPNSGTEAKRTLEFTPAAKMLSSAQTFVQDALGSDSEGGPWARIVPRFVELNYPVADLIYMPDDGGDLHGRLASCCVEDLVSLIVDTIVPGSWASAGGKGSLEFDAKQASLCVVQRPEIQEQVRQLFDQLRGLSEKCPWEHPPSIFCFLSGKADHEAIVRRRLNRPVATVEFRDTTLTQVVDDIGKMAGIKMVFDRPALDRDGFDLDRPITAGMKLQAGTVKSALEQLLQQVHLTFSVKGDTLVITTELVGGHLLQRVYPIADLLMFAGESGESAESLIQEIRTAVAPGSWSDEGGPGTIDYLDEEEALCVNQSPDALEQVQDLLDALRVTNSYPRRPSRLGCGSDRLLEKN